MLFRSEAMTKETKDQNLTLSLSEDGRMLAVGAPGEASDARGIDGTQTSNSAIGSGAVYLFVQEPSGGDASSNPTS